MVLTNPQSLNRYAYVLNNPVKFIDPSGLDCATYLENGGVNINSGDCPGIDPNNEYYIDCGEWGLGDGCLSGSVAYFTSDGQLELFNPTGTYAIPGFDYTAPDLLQQVFMLETAQYYTQIQSLQSQGPSLWSMSPSQRIRQIALAQPTVCGGGVFAYGGRSVDTGPVEAFAGGIIEADTRSGVSRGGLFEAGGGEGVVGGGGRIYTNGGNEPLIYGGAGGGVPGAHVSAGEVAFPSGAGVYADGSVAGWEGGVGAYVNITTNAACGGGQ